MKIPRFPWPACWLTVVLSGATLFAEGTVADTQKSQPKLTEPLTQPALPPPGPILARARHNSAIYGLYIWPGEYATHRTSIRSVGWKSFRVGGTLDDSAMRMLVEDGVEIIKTTGERKPKPDADPAGDEAFIQAHLDSLEALIRRYGNQGTFFRDHPALPHRPLRLLEAWNEPNFQYLIKPDERPRPAQEADREALFAKMQPAAYKKVKALDPGIIYAGFAAGASSAADLRFTENLHRINPAIAQSYDVFSTHPYVDDTPPECYSVRSWGQYSIASSLATLRTTMAQHGRKDVPVWYTEIGWEVSQKDGGKYPRPIETISPELQAAYTCRMYAYALRLGVERVTNMFATDTDGYNGGFFLADGSWRPSAHAVQTMIRLMPAPRLTEILVDGADGTFAYRFSPHADAGKASVIMVWNVYGPKTVELPRDVIGTVAKTVEVVEMRGQSQKIPVPPAPAPLQIQTGPLPVYLVIPAP